METDGCQVRQLLSTIAFKYDSCKQRGRESNQAVCCTKANGCRPMWSLLALTKVLHITKMLRKRIFYSVNTRSYVVCDNALQPRQSHYMAKSVFSVHIIRLSEMLTYTGTRMYLENFVFFTRYVAGFINSHLLQPLFNFRGKYLVNRFYRVKYSLISRCSLRFLRKDRL